MKLVFGKYSGYDTSDDAVPESYLRWLEEQPWVKERLRDALNDELERRGPDGRSSIGRDSGRSFQ